MACNLSLVLAAMVSSAERVHALDKAFYVADRLKTTDEDDHLEQYAATLFNCTLAMGNNLS
jgi:hypothetical protein